MVYDIRFEVSIPGIATRTLTRTVEADSLERAIEVAKENIVIIKIIAVNPAPPA